MYRAPLEVNRYCVRAERERAYRLHMNKLRSVRPSVDTRAPVVPQTVGVNAKKHEMERQKLIEIESQNQRLVHRLDRILKEEHYEVRKPMRPFTLQGPLQKEAMRRMANENKAMVNALQNSRPSLNRRDWYQHKIDHMYQATKDSENKATLPMSEIIRREHEEMATARRQKKEQQNAKSKEAQFEVSPPKLPQTKKKIVLLSPHDTLELYPPPASNQMQDQTEIQDQTQIEVDAESLKFTTQPNKAMADENSKFLIHEPEIPKGDNQNESSFSDHIHKALNNAPEQNDQNQLDSNKVHDLSIRDHIMKDLNHSQDEFENQTADFDGPIAQNENDNQNYEQNFEENGQEFENQESNEQNFSLQNNLFNQLNLNQGDAEISTVQNEYTEQNSNAEQSFDTNEQEFENEDNFDHDFATNDQFDANQNYNEPSNENQNLSLRDNLFNQFNQDETQNQVAPNENPITQTETDNQYLNPETSEQNFISPENYEQSYDPNWQNQDDQIYNSQNYDPNNENQPELNQDFGMHEQNEQSYNSQQNFEN